MFWCVSELLYYQATYLLCSGSLLRSTFLWRLTCHNEMQEQTAVEKEQVQKYLLVL